MIALDTNVLVGLLSQNPPTFTATQTALRNVTTSTGLCVCGAVVSELLGFPGRVGDDLKGMLQTMNIEIDWQFDEEAWIAAGSAYQGYVIRRRQSGGGLPRRMATDFLIGAHALVRGHDLFTLDQRKYRAAFPGLRVESVG